MTQELLDLRQSILDARYDDALALVDELDEMSRQSILRNIESFLTRLMVHLIKNQLEQRLTNSWAASISDSILKIKKLNLQGNRTAYSIDADSWLPFLEEAVEAAVAPASVESCDGRFSPVQLKKQINPAALLAAAETLLALTYSYSSKDLPAAVVTALTQLPGGQDWARGS